MIEPQTTKIIPALHFNQNKYHKNIDSIGIKKKYV